MPSNFSFEYKPQPYLDSSNNIVDIYRPIIPIRLSYNHRMGQPLFALIDSGADRNLFPAAFAIMLGIDVKKGITRKIGGIGNTSLTAYTHKIDLYINSTKFKTEVDFSYEHEMPLLGRNGFFNLFREVKFAEKAKLIEILI